MEASQQGSKTVLGDWLSGLAKLGPRSALHGDQRVRIGDRTKKGYNRDQFAEAFQRYLTPSGVNE